MADYTKYPLQIDTSNELPLTTDNVTAVKAEVVNRLREAILAIEAELGIQPSREYSTVRARLDALSEGGTGGGGSIELLEEGTLVASSVTSINFTGGVTLSQTSPLQVEVAVEGGQATQVQETLAVNSNGQTAFTLSDTPIQDIGVQMYLNGIKLRRGTDYSSTGTSVTYSGSPALITTDIVEFWYLVDLGGISGAAATLSVENNGTQIENDTTVINFGSGFTVTSTASGEVEVVRNVASCFIFSETQTAIANPDDPELVVFDTAEQISSDIAFTGPSSIIEINKTAIYQISGQVSFIATQDVVHGFGIIIYVDGTPVRTAVIDGLVLQTNTYFATIPFSFIIELTSGAEITVGAYHHGDGTSESEVVPTTTIGITDVPLTFISIVEVSNS